MCCNMKTNLKGPQSCSAGQTITAYAFCPWFLQHHTHTHTHSRGFLNHQAGKLNSIVSLNEFLSPNSNPGADHYRANSFFFPLSPPVPNFSPFCFFTFSLIGHHRRFSCILVTVFISVCSFLHRVVKGFRRVGFQPCLATCPYLWRLTYLSCNIMPFSVYSQFDFNIFLWNL